MHVLRPGRPHDGRMTHTIIQPPGILEIPGLTQVIVATGSRHVYIAGQIPLAMKMQNLFPANKA